MRYIGIVSAVFCVLAITGLCATARANDAVDIVAQGCKADIEAHCKGVTPGEGRVLSCLYAYGDKISTQCEYALYDAAAQLQRSVDGLAYAVSECRDDLKAYCSNIKPGEGRIAQCLEKNKDKVSARCKLAQKEIGLK